MRVGGGQLWRGGCQERASSSPEAWIYASGWMGRYVGANMSPDAWHLYCTLGAEGVVVVEAGLVGSILECCATVGWERQGTG